MKHQSQSVWKRYSSAHEMFFDGGIAGCAYCKSTFPARVVSEWIEDTPARTAVCPYCRIDAVIPEQGLRELVACEFSISVFSTLVVARVLDIVHAEKFFTK